MPLNLTSKSVILSCMIVLLSFILNSCRKDVLMSQAPSETLLAKTKLFYNKEILNLDLKARQLLGTSAQKNSVTNRKKPIPIWEDARLESTPDGKTIVTVPLSKFKIDSKTLDYTRKFTFTESEGEIVDGKIVEVYAAPEVISLKGEELIGKSGATKLNDFTGAILSYGLDYRFREGKYYQDGLAKIGNTYLSTKLPDTGARQAPTSIQKSPIASKILSYKPSNTIGATRPEVEDGQNCEFYYWVYMEKDDWGNIVYWELRGFAYAVCTANQDPTQPGGYEDYYIDCFGVLNGSAYNSTCGCIGGTTGISECPRDVTNKVTNPCISDGLEKALGKNVKSQIKSLMSNTFLANKDVNLEFYSFPFSNSQNLNTDAITNMPNSLAPYDQRISFNENLLPNKSEEYIVSTVYHEILHAYFAILFPKDQQGNFIVPSDHEYMATNYITTLTNDLKNLYPNLTQTEAWALSWGGLEKTTLYALLTVEQKATINSINIQFSTKPNPSNPSAISKGSYCP